nr:P-loop NTPase [Anaerosalibacter sp. Marseille-P3206]
MIDLNIDKIYEALGNVNDPELKRSLVDLNMIKSVSEEKGHVKVVVNLTTMGCPLKNTIKDDIIREVSALDEVKSVEVEFGEMTKEEKEKIFGVPEQKVRSFENTTVLAIGSGKGGVGKSTVTANLGVALSKMGYNVGIIDADILGYSIPQIMGIKDERPTVIGEQVIIPVEKEGVKIMSMGNLVGEDEALIWRGPILTGVLHQFLNEVHWGELDFLLLDLPPGTGDIPLSIMQEMKNSKFLIVTTPQITAKGVAKRLGIMAQKTNTEIIGVVENMSYFICDNCNEKHYIFGQGEGEKLSNELGVNFLGEIPLLKTIRESSDKGVLPSSDLESNIGSIYKAIGEKIIKNI